MIIATRYRDIPEERVLELHKHLPPATPGEWDKNFRGQPIEVETPSTSSFCGQPGYMVVGGVGRRVCSHIAELGD